MSRARPPLVRRGPLPPRYRAPRLLSGSQPLQDLQDFEDFDLGNILNAIPGVSLVTGLLGLGGNRGGGGGGGAAPAAGGAAGGPAAGVQALLNDPTALAQLGNIQGGGAASLLSAIRGNPTANATLGPLANAAIGAGLNGLMPGLGGVLGGALGGAGAGGLTPDLLQSLLQGRDLSQLQQQAIPRQTAEQVAQTLDPGLAQVRGMLEDQQRSAEATAQHRNIVAEDSFRQSVLAELAAVRADLGRVRDQGPPRW